jgi:hypothetical protein
LSAPASPPKSAPFPEPVLVIKKVMLDCWAWAPAVKPSASSAIDPILPKSECLIAVLPEWVATAGRQAPRQPIIMNTSVIGSIPPGRADAGAGRNPCAPRPTKERHG